MKYAISDVKKNSKFLNLKQTEKKIERSNHYIRCAMRKKMAEFDEQGYTFYFETKGGQVFTNDPKHLKNGYDYKLYLELEDKRSTGNKISEFWIDKAIATEIQNMGRKTKKAKPKLEVKTKAKTKAKAKVEVVDNTPPANKVEICDIDFETVRPLVSTSKIDARKLHTYLNIRDDYYTWIAELIHSLDKRGIRSNSFGKIQGGGNWISLNCAVSICNFSSSEKADLANRYFAECCNLEYGPHKEIETPTEKPKETAKTQIGQDLESYLPIKELRAKYLMLERAFQDPSELRDTLLNISDQSDLPAMQIRKNGQWETVVHPDIAKRLLLTTRDNMTH